MLTKEKPAKAPKKDPEALKTYDEIHMDLIADGFCLLTVSDSGSRYYSKAGECGFRVSDHNPNKPTEKWMWRRSVQDVRVQSGSKPVVTPFDVPEFPLGYHDRPEISRSMLAVFEHSPREYEAMYVTQTIQPDPETVAMAIGSFTHQQLLEPHIESRVKIIPKSVLAKNGARTTNAYKEWCVENEGSIFMKVDEYDTAMRAAHAVRKEIGNLIDNPNAFREREIFWQDEETGLDLRCKLDLVAPTDLGLHVADVKTCADLRRFNKQIADGLWMQDRHYTSGAAAEFSEHPEFFFCVVEKRGTYRVRNRELDDDSKRVCQSKYRALMNDLAKRLNSDDPNAWAEDGEGDIRKVSVKFWEND